MNSRTENTEAERIQVYLELVVNMYVMLLKCVRH